MDNSNLILENNINKLDESFEKKEENKELVSEKKDAFLDKNILLQATTERKMMEDSAIAMRKKAANDQKTVFAFEDLIPAITVPSEDQIPVQKLEISPDLLQLSLLKVA